VPRSRNIVEGIRLELNNPQTTYENFMSYYTLTLQASTIALVDGADLRKWMIAVEEEFQIKVVEIVESVDEEEEEVVECVSSVKTFSECRANLLFAIDKYDREIRKRQSIYKGPFEEKTAAYNQYLVNFFTGTLRDFNKILPPAANQCRDFLLYQKNVSQEKANELPQLLEIFAERLQEVIDIAKIGVYSAESQQTFAQLVESLDLAALDFTELLYKLVIEFQE